MSDPRIKVAVVGVGHLGRHHARLYAAHPVAELVAVVDSDQRRATEIAAEYGCSTVRDLRDLAGKIDAASVAVPTVHHMEVACRLLEAGVDLLVEKPLASGLEEADKIIETAKRAGRLLMVGHTERFNPAMMAMMQAVDAPKFFEIHRLSQFSARSTDINVVLDLMIHDLDLVAHLDGTEAVSVDAIGVSALTDKVDIANARIKFASGCVANLTASRISAEPVRRVRVFQARTYLACDTVRKTAERYRLEFGADGSPEINHQQFNVPDGEPLGNELDAFIKAVAIRETPPVGGAEGRRAMRLAYEVLERIG